MRLEDLLDEFARLGICLAPGVSVQDLLIDADRETLEAAPDNVLALLASSVEDPGGGWQRLSDQVTSFDFEGYVNVGNYVDLLVELCHLTGRPDRVSHATDLVIPCADENIGVGWLEYDLDGTRRHHDFCFQDDWADRETVQKVMGDLEEGGRRFWGMEMGQGPLVVYLDEERATRLNEIIGPRRQLTPLSKAADTTEHPDRVPAPVLMFDPMVQPATVDSLPAELGWRQLDVMADAWSVTARASGEAEAINPSLDVTVSAHRGRKLTDGPLLPSPGYLHCLVPGPVVDGQEAYWVEVLSDPHADPRRTGSETVLRWADDPGYFEVCVYGPEADARELALRVAKGVRHATVPVRLPFTMGRLPGGLFPQFVRVSHGAADRPWCVELRCAHEPMWGRPSGLPRGLEIRCYPSTELSNDRETPDRVVDGHPALFERRTSPRLGRSESLHVFNVDGHYLRILAMGERACEALDPSGGVLGLFRRIHFTPDDWTADPFS